MTDANRAGFGPLDDDVRAALAFVLWHHQGGSSRIGQSMRLFLGLGEHERMSDTLVTEAKRVQQALVPGGRDEHCWFDFALPYPQPPSAPQAVPSYQQAYEANCALVTALDRIRDIIDGKAPASDMGIHEIVNRALTLHRLAAPPAPSSEQPKEETR